MNKKVENRIKYVEGIIQEKLPKIVEFIEPLNWNLTPLKFSLIFNSQFKDLNVYFENYSDYSDYSDYNKTNLIRKYFIEGNYFRNNKIIITFSNSLLLKLNELKYFNDECLNELKQILLHEFVHREHNEISLGKIKFFKIKNYREYLSDDSEIEAISQDVIFDFLNGKEESYGIDLYESFFKGNEKTYKKFYKKLYKLWLM